jgi:hypothetical protein
MQDAARREGERWADELRTRGVAPAAAFAPASTCRLQRRSATVSAFAAVAGARPETDRSPAAFGGSASIGAGLSLLAEPALGAGLALPPPLGGALPQPLPVPARPAPPLAADAPATEPLLVNGVLVTGKSRTPSESQNLAKLLDPEWTGSWFSAPCDAFVCFDFGKKRVSVASYRLKTCAKGTGDRHLMEWVLEGQADGAQWIEIHTVKGDANLNGELREHTYDCPAPSPPYRCIRIRQTGPNHSGRPTGFGLSGVQLFGRVVMD